MTELFFIIYFVAIGYCCLKGVGWLFGFGLQKRWDNWSSENFMKSKKEYADYFKHLKKKRL